MSNCCHVGPRFDRVGSWCNTPDSVANKHCFCSKNIKNNITQVVLVRTYVCGSYSSCNDVYIYNESKTFWLSIRCIKKTKKKKKLQQRNNAALSCHDHVVLYMSCATVYPQQNKQQLIIWIHNRQNSHLGSKHVSIIIA